MMGGMVKVNGRIIRIPQNQTELNAAAPIFRYGICLKAMFEVYGTLVDVVAEGEEENTPKRLRQSRIYTTTCTGKEANLPGIAPGLENRTVFFFVQSSPALHSPCIDGSF
jgi:hypothetical protein